MMKVHMICEKKNDILNIDSTSYTWKDEYVLPYESYWSRIAKFGFLNGLSWSYVQNNNNLRKLIHKPMQFNSFYDYIPPFNSAKSIKYDRNYIFQSKYKAYKIYLCPICMNYGYHSVLHEIEGLNYCVFHKCNLIKIDGDAFYASKNGTYKFWNVKVENIVRNSIISKDIEEFIRKQKNQKYISNNYFFIDSIDKKCYESTERLYQNKVLLQDDIGLYGCKCIGFMQRKEIAQINKTLLDDIINSYIKNIEEKDFLYINFPSNEIKSFFIGNYISKREDEEIIREEYLLGWCFITVASEVIRKFFDNLDDWEITFYSLYDNTFLNIKDKTIITKIAVVLTFQAITGTTSADVIQRPDSWYWAKGHSISNCNLPIYFDLGQIVHSVPFRDGSCTRAAQYIVYPIIRDLFYDLVYRASSLLEQNFDITDKRLIQNILYDLRIIPQYAVFYYKDRVELYRCDPETWE